MSDDTAHHESIANIIRKFENIQMQTQLQCRQPLKDLSSRPATAPPTLSNPKMAVVQRKDDLISKLCEEVCYLNTQLVECTDACYRESDNIGSSGGIGPRTVFQDNYFVISGAVSPLGGPELEVNLSSGRDKPMQVKSIQEITYSTPDNIGTEAKQPINKLSFSPRPLPPTSSFSSNPLNLPTSDVSGDVISASSSGGDVVMARGQQQRRHQLTSSSLSDIDNTDNYRTSSREPATFGLMSSSDSLLNSEQEVLGSSAGGTEPLPASSPLHQGGLTRFGGFHNLHEAEEDVCSEPGVEEIVARWDWEDSPSRTRFGDMDEWALSDCDLPNGEIIESSSEDLEPLSNGYHHNGYQSDPFTDDELDLGSGSEGGDGFTRPILENGFHNNHENHLENHHGNTADLRESVLQTQEQCNRMFEEFRKLRRQLRSVSDRVYDRPMLTTSQQLACSRELLDNDSDDSDRHSVCNDSPSTRGQQPTPLAVQQQRLTWPKEQPNRLKRGKSSVRLFVKGDHRETSNTDSLSLREIVREVCSEEAVSDLAVLRSQLEDRTEEIEQLQGENDDLISSVTSLDAKVGELTEQVSKLQSLNRSLQAQNFNLSTTLSQKDVTFDKLKKYLHKGPPSRTQTASPLSSIPESSPNSAHKFGFVNRSTQSISRRKSLRPWKRRLAILDSNNLSIFKVETVESLIPTSSIIDIRADHKRLFGKHVIVLRTDDDKEHFFQAGSEADLQEWVDRIEGLMNQ